MNWGGTPNCNSSFDNTVIGAAAQYGGWGSYGGGYGSAGYDVLNTGASGGPNPGDGGGNSAGTSSNGNPPSGSTGGIAVAGGGPGGNGGATGSAPTSGPGGGGGSGSSGAGGSGCAGQIIITYTLVAAKVVFTTQPGGGQHGSVSGTQPVVSVEDNSGNVITDSAIAITLAIGTNAGSGTLSVNTNPLNASSGVASFSGCSIDKSGTGYTLQATASGLTTATSSTFNITGIANTKSLSAATATMSGSAGRKTSKSSAASIATMAGSIMRGRSLSSSLAAMAGSTGRATGRALAASVAVFAAALVAAHLKFSALTASLAIMSGVLYRRVARSLASGTATLGAVFTAARVARTFTQALPSSAAVFSASFSTAHRVLTSLAASMSTLAGSVTKQIQKSFGAN